MPLTTKYRDNKASPSSDSSFCTMAWHSRFIVVCRTTSARCREGLDYLQICSLPSWGHMHQGFIHFLQMPGQWPIWFLVNADVKTGHWWCSDGAHLQYIDPRECFDKSWPGSNHCPQICGLYGAQCPPKYACVVSFRCDTCGESCSNSFNL